MQISPFSFDDYKEYIHAQMASSTKLRGLVSEMADACGCQRSYFSQVIHSHIHLTPDHALALAEYLNLSKTESKYFCLLVDLARAATPKLKRNIQEELSDLKKQNENLSQRFKKQSVEPGERELLYYSAWYYSAAHVLLTIPKFQSTEAISQKIGLPAAQVQKILHDLERQNFIKRDGKKWLHVVGDIHLPKKSLLNVVNHQNWRTQAVLQSQRPESDGVHYTSVASLSAKDFEKIKSQILELIDQSRKIISDSPEEELACLTLDWFHP